MEIDSAGIATKPNAMIYKNVLCSTVLPVANVTVLDLVFPTDLLVLAGSLDSVLAAVLLDIVDAEHLTTDELLLEIGVNDTCSLWRLETFPESPSSHLIWTCGKVSDEIQTVVTSLCDLAKCASDVVTKSGEFCSFSFGRAESEESLLEGDGEGNEQVTWVVLVNPLLDLGKPLVLLSDIVTFGEVDEVDDWLCRQELEVVDDFDL